MAHPKIIQQQVFGWIEGNLGHGKSAPSDAEIASHFNLLGVQSARSLLADLADAGKITIKGFGDERTIALGRPARATAAITRPTPSVVKRTAGKRDDADVDAVTAKICDIISRGKAAVAPPAPSPVPVSPAAACPPEDSGRGEGARPPVSPVPVEAAPHRIAPVVAAFERLPTAPDKPLPQSLKGAARQLNIALPAVDFDKLAARALAVGEMPGAYARKQMLAILHGESSSTTTRSIIPASLAAAAIRDGLPIVEFAQRMMALGLAAYANEKTKVAA